MEDFLRHRAEIAKTQIEQWKDACGLECGGDQDGVTPSKAMEKLKAAIRRIFLHAVDREICDSIAKGFALATIAGICEEAIGSWCEKCEKIGCDCKDVDDDK